MHDLTLDDWVRRKRASATAGNLGVGALGLLGGVLVLFITFWFAYAIIFIGTMGASGASELILNKRLHLSHEMRLAGAGLFIVLLFIGNARTNRWYLGDYSETQFSSFGIPRSELMGAFDCLLVYPGTSSKMIAGILCISPRLLTASWRTFRQARRLQSLDVSGCAAILSLLASSPRRASNEALAQVFPGWDLPGLTRQLLDLDCVIPLELGLGLKPEIRQELASLITAPPPLEVSEELS